MHKELDHFLKLEQRSTLHLAMDCFTIIPRLMRWEGNIGVVNIVAIFTRVLLHEDARTSPSMTEVGDHVTASCSLIGRFRIRGWKREM